MKVDFCEYCNAPLESVERQVTVYRHRRGQHFIFEDVPARLSAMRRMILLGASGTRDGSFDATAGTSRFNGTGASHCVKACQLKIALSPLPETALHQLSVVQE